MQEDEHDFTQDELRLIRDQHEPWIRNHQGVVGTGVGPGPDGRMSLEVYTNKMSEETRKEITEHLAGVPVVFEETVAQGYPRPFGDNPQSRR
jgi:hypothetical protein